MIDFSSATQFTTTGRDGLSVGDLVEWPSRGGVSRGRISRFIVGEPTVEVNKEVGLIGCYRCILGPVEGCEHTRPAHVRTRLVSKVKEDRQ